MAFLDGIRVLTFTSGVAGPNAGRLLAQSGAEVIKFESLQGGLDSFRFFSPDGDIEASPRLVEANLNVLSAQLNLKSPKALELLKELVAKSDIVLDNFRPDVMPRLGLGYEDLRKIKEDIIVIKMPGLGSDGPKAKYGSWGTTVMAYSGMTALWNHPNQPHPIGTQTVYPDYEASTFAPMIALSALLHRKRTGKGVFLDLSQGEMTAFLLGVSYLQAAVTGKDPLPQGNDRPYAAPHNAYRCQGEDRWCAIVVETEDQWHRFCDTIGRPELATDPRFATLATRRANLGALDEEIGAWTKDHTPHEAMEILQKAGVPCGAVQDGRDLFHDQHLRARGFVHEIDHLKLGHVALSDIPIKTGKKGINLPVTNSVLGQHNAHVYGQILGYSPSQIAAWQEEGVIK